MFVHLCVCLCTLQTRTHVLEDMCEDLGVNWEGSGKRECVHAEVCV